MGFCVPNSNNFFLKFLYFEYIFFFYNFRRTRKSTEENFHKLDEHIPLPGKNKDHMFLKMICINVLLSVILAFSTFLPF